MSSVIRCLGEASLEPPSYYLTKPLGGFLSLPGQGDVPQRFSRRARGLGVCEVAAIKSLAESQQSSNATAPSIRMVTKRIRFRRTTAPKSSHLKSPWLKGRRRPMYKKVVVYIDEHGNEVAGPNPTVNRTEESNAATASSVAGKKNKSESCASSPKKMNTSTNSSADVDATGQELSPSDKKRTSRSKTSESDCIESCSPVRLFIWC